MNNVISDLQGKEPFVQFHFRLNSLLEMLSKLAAVAVSSLLLCSSSLVAAQTTINAGRTTVDGVDVKPSITISTPHPITPIIRPLTLCAQA